MNFIIGGSASAKTMSKEIVKNPSVSSFVIGAAADSRVAVGVTKSPIVKTNPTNRKHLSDDQVKSRRPAKRRKRTPWTKEEDNRLIELVENSDLRDEGASESATALTFIDIARELENGRTSKQCRDRYKNFLRVGIKKGGWTVEEDELIKDMYATFGARWSAMTKLLTNRSDNDIKNKWYSMKRKEARSGVCESGWTESDFESYPNATDSTQRIDESYQQRNFGRKVKPL